MKMLMVIIDEERKEELEVFLGRSGVMGYTEIAPVLGTGRSGPRLGSGAFPKTSAVVLTVLTDAALAAIRQELADFCERCGGPVHLFAWQAEQLLP